MFGQEVKEHYLTDHEEKIELAKAWVHAQLEANHHGPIDLKRRLSGYSFPCALLRKSGLMTSTATPLFKKSNPKTYLDLCKVMGACARHDSTVGEIRN